MKRLVIVGGGFAGVWAALAAAQQRADTGPADADATITLVNRDPWLTIRPRLYEAALEDVRVPLAAVMDPVGVELVQAEVRLIDTDARRLAIDGAEQPISYDCLVLAGGSHAARPRLPTLAHAFGVEIRSVPVRVYDPPVELRHSHYDKLWDTVRIIERVVGLMLRLR